MPIDASSHPFDDGHDLGLDDLDRAGTGAAGAALGDKAVGGFGDDDVDDLDKAGKGAGAVDLDDDVKVFGGGGDDAGLDDDAFDPKLGLESAVDDLDVGDPLDDAIKDKSALDPDDDDLFDDDDVKDKDDDFDVFD